MQKQINLLFGYIHTNVCRYFYVDTCYCNIWYMAQLQVAVSYGSSVYVIIHAAISVALLLINVTDILPFKIIMKSLVNCMALPQHRCY